MKTRIFHPETDQDVVTAAAEILRRGGLLGIPTETVYGLGADGLNEEAVRAIFRAKGRPQDNPLILHVPSAAWLERYCRDVPPAAYDLAARFWPGPGGRSCLCAPPVGWRRWASAARTTL